MFDMHSIGRKIAELRLQKDLTQMELADLLNISFQAVSNWERGISMPDISKLPELAEIFAVSVDELLGKGSPLLESVLTDQMEGYLEKSKVTVGELSEVAPLLKPSQVKTIFEHTESEDFNDVVFLAPFLEQAVLHKIVVRMLENGQSIASFLPFLDCGTVEELAGVCYEKSGFKALASFFPFLPQEVLKEMAEREYELSDARNLGCIAPFLNQSNLVSLSERIIEKDGLQGIQSLLPFLSSDQLTRFVTGRLK